MRYCSFGKEDLGLFFDSLLKDWNVVAPVKKETQFVFRTVTSLEEVGADYFPTILPPKKYFLPQHEKMVDFTRGHESGKSASVGEKPTVIFGMRTCDIAGVGCLDTVFKNNPQDENYVARSKNVVIIGWECMKPCDEKATCSTMGTHVPRGGYDIMLTDMGDKYAAHINSENGLKLVQGLDFIRTQEQEPALPYEIDDIRAAKVKDWDDLLSAEYSNLQNIYQKSYESGVWEDDLGKRCVSCGNCTAVCPTCYCFDMYDETDLKITDGGRYRVWDSCQLEDFAKVAGNENFREERGSRQRHRYLRKFLYPMMKHNKYFCVGCGRCTRTCMSGISLIETTNKLTEEYGNE